MNQQEIISSNFSSLRDLLDVTIKSESQTIENIAQVISSSIIAGGTVFWCGNGGSAAESQHMAAELIGVFARKRDAYASLALTTDSSVLTCISNDFDFDQVFSRQISGLGRNGDVLIGISSSGNSRNVNNAIIKAKEIGIVTISLSGKGGGLGRGLADYEIVIQSESTPRIQEVHTLINHSICGLVEDLVIDA